MPKELERKLIREGKKMGLTGERLDRYVYGTLRKTGWKPERERRKTTTTTRKKTRKRKGG